MTSSAEGSDVIGIKPLVLRRLAAMICGDTPYNEHFPYRSGSSLTGFFDDLWLDYTHDGSPRQRWVEAVLFDLALPNDIKATKESLWSPVKDQRFILTDDLRRVIAHIVDPLHFTFKPGHLEPAIHQLNEVLEHDRLQVLFDEASDKKAVVFSLDGQQVSGNLTEPEVSLPGVLIVRPKVFRIPERRTLEVPQCGILMPFRPLFNEIYEREIKSAVQDAGYNPLRADEIWKNEVLVDDIVDLIFHSSVIIADLSERNPNVLYELGLAHTMGKLVVPIVQDPQDIPFDIKHHRYLQYDATAAGRESLRTKLTDRLKQLAG